MNKFIAVPIALVVTALLTSATYSNASTEQPSPRPTRASITPPTRVHPHEDHVASVKAIRAAESEANLKLWNDKIAWDKAVAHHKAHVAAEAARKAEAAKATRGASHKAAPQQSASPSVGTGRCGGDLPPCYVMMRESRGDIRAENPTSTASGKWQFVDGTWAGFGGYSHASYAPESVQDAKARILWANGAGCSHWSAC